MLFRNLMLSLLAHLAFTAIAHAGAPDAKQTEPPEKPAPFGVAHIELKGSYPDGPQAPGLFGDVVEGLSAIIARLDKAAGDDNVAAVSLHINGPEIGWAKMNDLRQAIGRVRAKGKKVHAYLDEAASIQYLLATGCDEIVMPESGMLMILGLRAEVDFYRNLLDLLRIKPDMLRMGAYKSAAEPYMNTEMSKEFREEMDALLDDYYAILVDTIASGRKLDAEKVKAAIDAGPFTAAEAKKLGLVDRIAYPDEIESQLKESHPGRDVKIVKNYGKKKVDTDFSGLTGMVKMMNLLMGAEPAARKSSAPKIAVIHANGMIVTGKSTASILGNEVMGSETMVKAIEDAGGDKTVKAIVLRIDSPGGSALASDLIWRALEKVEKPVVVSMGDVAGSGGYYIAMGADRIFAEPGTITGSIGVVGGKLGLRGLYQMAGIHTTVLSRGKNSGALSMLDGFTDSERTAMTKLLQDIYEQFTTKAAKGRKMDHDKLVKLAGGRIYSGAAAVKNGLVDELGTLEDAFAHARKLGGFNPDDKVERLILPKPTSPLEALLGPLDPEASASARTSAAVRETLDAISPELTTKLQALETINLLAREPRLTLMPFRLKVK